MSIEYNRKGDTCDRCKKSNTEVGKITNYKKYNENLLLCTNCIQKIDKEKTQKCSKCKKIIGIDGLIIYKNKSMCYECTDIVKKKDAEKKKLSQFFKSNWQFFIGLGVGIVGIILAYLALK